MKLIAWVTQYYQPSYVSTRAIGGRSAANQGTGGITALSRLWGVCSGGVDTGRVGGAALVTFHQAKGFVNGIAADAPLHSVLSEGQVPC